MDTEDVVYIIWTMEYYSAVKKNEILPFAARWMALEGIMLNEMSDKERQILYGITDTWSLNNKCTGHSKHPLPTTQEKTLHMDITRWSIPKSD